MNYAAIAQPTIAAAQLEDTYDFRIGRRVVESCSYLASNDENSDSIY